MLTQIDMCDVLHRLNSNQSFSATNLDTSKQKDNRQNYHIQLTQLDYKRLIR